MYETTAGSGCYTACDYKKAVLKKVPNNYHIEYDGHYYSVFYPYCGKPAILKATASEIRICDQYNRRLICTHKRSYKEFPLYITVDEHMPPDHLYYKKVNSKDGNYYRRWASAIGPAMSLIDRLLKSSKHEEQSYNACAGILHKNKNDPERCCGRSCPQMYRDQFL